MTRPPARGPVRFARHGALAPVVRFGRGAATAKKQRPKLSELKGTLTIGDQTFELAGREVLVHARFAVAREWLRETPIVHGGVDLAYGRVKVRFYESHATIEAQDDLGLWPQSREGSPQ